MLLHDAAVVDGRDVRNGAVDIAEVAVGVDNDIDNYSLLTALKGTSVRDRFQNGSRSAVSCPNALEALSTQTDYPLPPVEAVHSRATHEQAGSSSLTFKKVRGMHAVQECSSKNAKGPRTQ